MIDQEQDNKQEWMEEFGVEEILNEEMSKQQHAEFLGKIGMVILVTLCIALVLLIIGYFVSSAQDNAKAADTFTQAPVITASSVCQSGNWLFITANTPAYAKAQDTTENLVAKFPKNTLAKIMEDVVLSGTNANGVFTYHMYRLSSEGLTVPLAKPSDLWVGERSNILPIACVPLQTAR